MTPTHLTISFFAEDALFARTECENNLADSEMCADF